MGTQKMKSTELLSHVIYIGGDSVGFGFNFGFVCFVSVSFVIS